MSFGHISRRSLAGKGTVFAIALLMGGTVLAACGGAASASVSAKGSSRTRSAPTLATDSVPGVGTVLTNSQGHTLYLFSTDEHKTVTCTSSNGCSAVWPVFETSGAVPKAGKGVKKSLIGTIKFDGHTVVTYNHWPLYTFAEDSGSHQAHGEGLHSFGGTWYAMTPRGTAAKVTTTKAAAKKSNSKKSTSKKSTSKKSTSKKSNSSYGGGYGY